MRTLFAVAGALQPAVIFVDEIDSLLNARKADGEEVNKLGKPDLCLCCCWTVLFTQQQCALFP